jgi:hypothetical protein
VRCIDHRGGSKYGSKYGLRYGLLFRLKFGPLCGAALLLLACSSPMPPPTERSTERTSAPAATAVTRLPASEPARNWSEFRQQAARRLMAANPERTYSGAVPDPLLAIPVLEVELNADGSILAIDVLRVPRQAKDTVQIAIDAVRRAAPFPNVSRLPKPWKYSETFLFNDDRKFKPRTLDP